MNLKIRKIDAIIVVALLIIAGIVLFRTGVIDEPGKKTTPRIDIDQDDAHNKLIIRHVSKDVLWLDITIQGECDKSHLGNKVIEGDEITSCKGTISLIYDPTGAVLGSWTFTEKDVLPESIVAGNLRAVSPEDQGAHFNTKIFGEEFFREWWYYTMIFDEDSDLAGWTMTVSFNHMARNDLFLLKPDILFIVIHSPDGKEYGGIIERERPIFGIINQPVLQAASSNSNVKISFEESYVSGLAPNWNIHIEGENLDPDVNIVMDLQFTAQSDPYWLHSTRAIDKSKGNIASYTFLGCNVEGTVSFDDIPYEVKGIGHHEHTWASGIFTKSIIRGWDWCHMKLDNGWEIYFNNYYFTPQIKTSKVYDSNAFANVIITTNNGKTLTILDEVTTEIIQSDKVFLLLNIPNEEKVIASPGTVQVFLKTYSISLNLNIETDNSLDNTWRYPAHVGMKIGRSTVSGLITWTDDSTLHEVELNGIATTWNMRH